MNSYHCKRPLLTLTVILALAFARSIAQIASTPYLQKETQEKIDKDIRLIKSAIELLVRPQFEGIPTVVQKLNEIKGKSEYYFLGELSKNLVVISSKANDHGKNVIIFPMGENGFGRIAKNSYAVLRKSKSEKDMDTYFLNIAYLRNVGKKTAIEWSTVEVAQYRKSALELELCRKDTCEFSEWILGTCQIVEHSCGFGVGNKAVQFSTTKLPRTMITEEEMDSTVAVPIIQKRNAAGYTAEEAFEGNEALLVPSSLDLLMRRKKYNTDSDNYDSTFKNNVLRTRSVSSDHLESLAVQCIQCQTMFDFFWDLEEDSSEFSQQIRRLIEKEYKIFPMQNSSISVTQILQAHPNIPFVGFGNCNYSLGDLNKPISKEIDDIAEFYLGTLRKDCDNVAQSDLRGWLTSRLKFLRIDSDFTLGLMTNSQLLKSKMLSSEEFEMIMTIMLFSEYTNLYYEERASININDTRGWTFNPVGLKISKTCKFLTKLFLRFITTVRRVLDNHLVKSLRTIIRYMKDKFLSLLVEKRKLGIASDKISQDSTELITNDLHHMMALKEFTLYGLGPVFKSGTSPAIAFESFYKLNKNRIGVIIKAYMSNRDRL